MSVLAARFGVDMGKDNLPRTAEEIKVNALKEKVDAGTKEVEDLIRQLNSMGANPQGMEVSRHEMFFHFLKDEGIIPEDIWLRFQVKWNDACIEDLSKVVIELQNRMRGAKTGLAKPGGPRLIVPGH
jgi:hypothetical protein